MTTTRGTSQGDETLVVGEQAPEQSAAYAPGETLGRYLLIGEVGRGAMGVVMRAYDPKLQREVALKVLRTRAVDSVAHQRMVREARAMAKLNHPNVVAVYDVDQLDSGTVVVAMELVEGVTLAEWQASKHAPGDVVARFVQAGRGLQAAHAAGLLHRDFKPSNVLVGADDAVGGSRCRVTDFGLARLETGAPPSLSSSIDSEADEELDPQLTTEGVVMGTPTYMAPEQHGGGELTAATDQYAFCVSLWEGLAGKRPFASKGGLRELLAAKLDGPPEWTGPPVPKRLLAAMRRGLSPAPAERWPAMEPLLDELEAALAPRSRAIGVGVGAAAVVVSAAVLWPEASTPCSGAADEIAGTWGDEPRERVADAFAASRVPVAELALQRTTEALDAYAEAWAVEHGRACRATTVQGERSPEMLDRSMACLARARQSLAAAVELLASGADDVVIHAHELSAELPPVAQCTDLDVLQADVAPPSPDIVDEVAELQGSLAAAAALRRAGRFDDALAAAREVEERAAAVAYRPLQSEVELEIGTDSIRAGKYEEAREVLEAALSATLELGQREVAKEVALELAYLLSSKDREPSAGWVVVSVARGLVDEQADPVGYARLLGYSGILHNASGDRVEGIANLRRSLDLLRGALDDDPRLANAMNSLAVALGNAGEPEESERLHRETIALRRRLLGDSHPDVADSRHNLAITLRDLGRNEEAESELRAALAIQRAALGPDHPHVAQFHIALGRTLYMLKKDEEAEAVLRDGVRLMQKGFGPRTDRTAAAHRELASVLARRGKLDEALAEYRAVLEIQQHVFGTQHVEVAYAHNNLAWVHRLRKEGAAGAEHSAIAVELGRKVLPHDSPELAQLVHNLGRYRYEDGEVEEGRRLLEEAWRVREEAEKHRPDRRGETAFILAMAVWDAGEHERARGLAETALADFQSPDSAPINREEVEKWLASHPLPDG